MKLFIIYMYPNKMSINIITDQSERLHKSKLTRWTLDRVKTESVLVHGNKYDYS
jgi:hypothetical protein